MQHINPNDAANWLYSNGINYFSSIRLSPSYNKRVTYGIGFKCDSLSDDQREKLAQFDNVEIVQSGPQYAPEIRSPLIIFKTAAQMKREGK